MANPKVTVLMPVYNGEKYLKKAVDSILGQSFTDFEFLIINDGSTDNSRKIIESYADPRIRIIDNGTNLKLIKSLNKGIELSRGEYIARMDADDISLPWRLEKQVKYLDSRPDIGACGALTKIIGLKTGYVEERLADPEEIKANHLFHPSLAHPSVMIRKNIIDKYHFRFDEQYPHCEDYEFWARFSKVSKLSNLNEVLLLYRLHDNRVSNIFADLQGANKSRVREKELRAFGIDPTADELNLHQQVNCPDNNIRGFLSAKEKWLTKLLEHNKIKKYYEQKALSQIIKHHWVAVCQANAAGGFMVIKHCLKSPLLKPLAFKDTGKIAKLFARSIMKNTG